MNDNNDELIGLINQLLNLFKSNKNVVVYNNIIQDKANHLFDKIATITNTYNKNINNEFQNIENDLTIIDRKTGLKIQLVDPISMAENFSIRVYWNFGKRIN